MNSAEGTLTREGQKTFVDTRPRFIRSYPQATSPFEDFHTLTQGEVERIELSGQTPPENNGSGPQCCPPRFVGVTDTSKQMTTCWHLIVT